jgi:hypothetical protein
MDEVTRDMLKPPCLLNVFAGFHRRSAEQAAEVCDCSYTNKTVPGSLAAYIVVRRKNCKSKKANFAGILWEQIVKPQMDADERRLKFRKSGEEVGHEIEH